MLTSLCASRAPLTSLAALAGLPEVAVASLLEALEVNSVVEREDAATYRPHRARGWC